MSRTSLPRTAVNAFVAVTVAAGMTFGTSGTAHASKTAVPQPKTLSADAQRSVAITFINSTACDLIRDDFHVSHGEWTETPPPQILAADPVAFFSSESAGTLTGTEGTAGYHTENCADATRKGKRVAVHWDNPWSGGNTFDYADTDHVFWTKSPPVNDHHNNASVVFQVK